VASISESLSESVSDLRANTRYRGVHCQGTTLQTHPEAKRSIAPDTRLTGGLSSFWIHTFAWIYMRRPFGRLLSGC